MKKLFLDLDRCIGAKACVAACCRTHQNSPIVEMGDVVDAALLPEMCRQCENPACLAACPKDAIFRDEKGIVRRSNSRCIGCKSCVYACPFGAIADTLGTYMIAKCDMCADRQAKGLMPACVASCPSGALRFDEIEDIRTEKKYILLGGHTMGRHPYWRR